MIRIQRLPPNAHGRDFVMGDLHGEKDMLTEALDRVGFDLAYDRLFSVGDLIDRGPSSRWAVGLLDLPNFFAVLGNHEAMMIRAVLHGEDRARWVQEGGGWADSLDQAEQNRLASRLAELPHLIVVGNGPKRFHIVHAGIVDRASQPLTDAVVDTRDIDQLVDYRALLHARGHAERYKAACAPGVEPDERLHPGLSITFCGHSPVQRPGLSQSHYFCDGGAGSEIYLPPGQAPRLHVLCIDDLMA